MFFAQDEPGPLRAYVVWDATQDREVELPELRPLRDRRLQREAEVARQPPGHQPVLAGLCARGERCSDASYATSIACWVVRHLLEARGRRPGDADRRRGSDMAAVIHHLFQHASRSGTAALEGSPGGWAVRATLGPALPVAQRLKTARLASPSSSKSSRSGGRSFTRMDADWWMGHHHEPFN